MYVLILANFSLLLPSGLWSLSLNETHLTPWNWRSICKCGYKVLTRPIDIILLCIVSMCVGMWTHLTRNLLKNKQLNPPSHTQALGNKDYLQRLVSRGAFFHGAIRSSHSLSTTYAKYIRKEQQQQKSCQYANIINVVHTYSIYMCTYLHV